MPTHHAILIREALTKVPLNTIFVLIPFNVRPAENFENLFNETTKCLRSIANFKEMVVIVITKFDQCDPEDKPEAE